VIEEVPKTQKEKEIEEENTEYPDVQRVKIG